MVRPLGVGVLGMFPYNLNYFHRVTYLCVSQNYHYHNIYRPIEVNDVNCINIICILPVVMLHYNQYSQFLYIAIVGP